MTAVTSHQISTTAFDRVLLGAASALDRFVATRLERRAVAAESAAASRHDDTRSAAQARGAIGILPR